MKYIIPALTALLLSACGGDGNPFEPLTDTVSEPVTLPQPAADPVENQPVIETEPAVDLGKFAPFMGLFVECATHGRVTRTGVMRIDESGTYNVTIGFSSDYNSWSTISESRIFLQGWFSGLGHEFEVDGEVLVSKDYVCLPMPADRQQDIPDSQIILDLPQRYLPVTITEQQVSMKFEDYFGQFWLCSMKGGSYEFGLVFDANQFTPYDNINGTFVAGMREQRNYSYTLSGDTIDTGASGLGVYKFDADKMFNDEFECIQPDDSIQWQ